MTMIPEGREISLEREVNLTSCYGAQMTDKRLQVSVCSSHIVKNSKNCQAVAFS